MLVAKEQSHNSYQLKRNFMVLIVLAMMEVALEKFK